MKIIKVSKYSALFMGDLIDQWSEQKMRKINRKLYPKIRILLYPPGYCHMRLYEELGYGKSGTSEPNMAVKEGIQNIGCLYPWVFGKVF